MKIVNLTPHTVNVFDESGKTQIAEIPSSGVARVAVTNMKKGEVAGIPLFKTLYGEVVGLPPKKRGTRYVVSLLVRQALLGRTDLLSPGELIRDSEGKPIGCKGLVVT